MSGWKFTPKTRIIYSVNQTNMSKKSNYPLSNWRDHLNLNNAVVAVALVIAIGWIWGTIGALQKNFALQQKLDTIQQKNANLRLRNKNLKLQQTYYKTDEYLELELRRLFSQARPGERLLILPQNYEDTPPKPATTDKQSSPTKPGNFSRWMRFLFGNKPSGS